MRRGLRWIVAAMLVMALAGCGSEVSVTATWPVIPVVYPPTITDLHYTNDNAQSYVNGSIRFTDYDADLAVMTISVVNAAAREVARNVIDVRPFGGYFSSTLTFSIDYLTYLPGTYTFAIWLEDSVINLSNPVYGSFVVR